LDSLDVQTDALIQRALRTAFGRQTTLIVVAHRLSTIADMVSSVGRVVECR
jgi:ABC-type multidrug transport system fused ATPase/permease subunit